MRWARTIHRGNHEIWSYRYISNFKYVCRDMTSAQTFPDGLLYFPHQLRRESMPRAHFQEEENAFVLVLWSTLSNAQRVVENVRELLHYSVNLSRTKTNAARVEHAITAEKQFSTFGPWNITLIQQAKFGFTHLRPRINIPLVTGLTTMKSPCRQTPIRSGNISSCKLYIKV